MTPSVTRLVGESLMDLLRHPHRHLLASLPVFLAWLGGSFLLYPLTSFVNPWVFRGWYWLEDELVGGALYLLWNVMVAPFLVVILAFLPLQVGLIYAEHAWLERREPLRLTSAFPRRQALAPTLLALSSYLLEHVLLFLGFLPGVVAQSMLDFSVVAMVVHGVSAGEGVRMSVAHFARAPFWRLKLALVLLVAITVCSSLVVPMLILPSFHANLCLRAYRAVYGSDARPRAL